MAKGLTLQEQADELLAKAEEKGIQTNFFFRTTFKRYQVQMQILSDSKEYVKGRKNLYTNPAITEYNKTATAANGTVATLINIVKSLSEDGETKTSKLEQLLNEIDD